MGKYWNHSKESKQKISRAASKRYAGRKVLVNCIKCDKEFSTTIANQEAGRGKYCSKNCMYADRRGKRYSPETEFKGGQKPKNYLGNKETCEECGVEFEAAPSAKRKFCSKQCLIDNGYREFSCLECGDVRLEIKSKELKFCSNKCQGRFYSGDKHPMWDGGKTSEHEKIRKSKEYSDWRTTVFERDNYTCQVCGVRGGRLHADHIKPFAEYPELRLELKNGRTLCRSCHRKTPTYGRKKK